MDQQFDKQLALTSAQALHPPPDGGYPNGNTAEGTQALFSLTTGSNNTAIGFQALRLNNADENTAIGAFALSSNTGGLDNTAAGFNALASNTTGNDNTANGAFALRFNTTGFNNTATGVRALLRNRDGVQNTANGIIALQNNTSGVNNTASGAFALSSNTVGSDNTANGSSALDSNTEGSDNTASGFAALGSNTTGNNNIALGVNAGSILTAGDNNIYIGNAGVDAESNTIRIGTVGTHTKTFIAGIRGATVSGIGVVVNANGRLGVNPSSQRFKDEIKPMDKVSEAILALKPVTFRYKQEIDPERTPQFGLVAEDVDKVNPDLVARDAKGEVYTVRYEAVNAMLLNEFLKQYRKVQQQDVSGVSGRVSNKERSTSPHCANQ
jgi:hypothetical protein